MLPEILQSCLLSDRVKPEFGGGGASLSSQILLVIHMPRQTSGLLLRSESWIFPLRRKNELPSWSFPQHLPPLHPLHRPPGTRALCEMPSAD